MPAFSTRRTILALACVLASASALGAQPARTTFANPIDIDYRFMPAGVSRREAADPAIVLLGNDYYLFASKSGGYWYSPDMRDWKFVAAEGYPLEDYAPAVVAIDGRLYYTAHRSKGIFTTDDPKAGKWRKVADIGEYGDPSLFLDDDGRLYLYHGLGLNGSISVVELDPHDNFKVVSGPTKLMTANYLDHGWERSGEDNLGATMTEGFRIGPFVEGSWMTKHDGTYYLQYAAPGTVWKTYADGVYTSRSPTSGFTYAPYSPFSYKPGGFAGSAGHSGEFRDKAGNYWRVTTMDISVLQKFERRIGIFPSGFDADGVMRVNTYLGDYPQFLPGVVRSPLDSSRTNWMLLSVGMPATASSQDDKHPTEHAFDEDIRTQWSARTGNAGEWLRVDLGAPSELRALQVNFGELDMKSFGRETDTHQQYVVEGSVDGKRWSMIADRSKNTRDAPHEYIELASPVSARYVRITASNATPAGGKFGVRDLRIFGRSSTAAPPEVKDLRVARNADDERTATLSWTKVPRAHGYIVRFGIAPNKLYGNFQVGDVSTLTMNSLNKGVKYYFVVDALGVGGVTKGTIVRRGT
jgi:hypothetical protein